MISFTVLVEHWGKLFSLMKFKTMSKKKTKIKLHIGGV